MEEEVSDSTSWGIEKTYFILFIFRTYLSWISKLVILSPWIFQCLTVLQRLDVWLSGGNDLCVWNRKFDLLCKTSHLSDTGKDTSKLLPARIGRFYSVFQDAVILKETFHEYRSLSRDFFSFLIILESCSPNFCLRLCEIYFQLKLEGWLTPPPPDLHSDFQFFSNSISQKLSRSIFFFLVLGQVPKLNLMSPLMFASTFFMIIVAFCSWFVSDRTLNRWSRIPHIKIVFTEKFMYKLIFKNFKIFRILILIVYSNYSNTEINTINK